MSLGPDPEFRPLGGKAYGSIPHLPGSRTGAADRHLSHNHARICTERARDAQDPIDGAVWRVERRTEGRTEQLADVVDSVAAMLRPWVAAATEFPPTSTLQREP